MTGDFPSRLLSVLPVDANGRTGWPWTAETTPSAGAPQGGWPKITIVTPSYQQAAYLEETIRSVLLQNYPALEYLVLDAGSTDGSVAIIERYAAHLAYWHSKPDGGQANAINQGFARATGEILAWINSDDLLLPGALFAVAQAFRNGAPDIVYGDALNLFEEDRTLQYWQGYWIRPSFLQYGGLFSSHAMYWRRAIHVPLWEELNCNVDGELWQRLVPGHKLHHLKLPLGVYRAHAETKSNADKWREKWRQDDEKIWSRHGQPNRSRVFRRLFHGAQRIYKWMTWRQEVAARRAVLAACDWSAFPWRGPVP